MDVTERIIGDFVDFLVRAGEDSTRMGVYAREYLNEAEPNIQGTLSTRLSGAEKLLKVFISYDARSASTRFECNDNVVKVYDNQIDREFARLLTELQRLSPEDDINTRVVHIPRHIWDRIEKAGTLSKIGGSL